VWKVNSLVHAQAQGDQLLTIPWAETQKKGSVRTTHDSTNFPASLRSHPLSQVAMACAMRKACRSNESQKQRLGKFNTSVSSVTWKKRTPKGGFFQKILFCQSTAFFLQTKGAT
jgi:hypothetical protein